MYISLIVFILYKMYLYKEWEGDHMQFEVYNTEIKVRKELT